MSIRIRPVVHEDRDRLLAFYRSLSPESLHARFFEACSPDAALASSPVDVDRRNTVGVVAELGEQIAASLTISGSATQRKSLLPFAMICNEPGMLMSPMVASPVNWAETLVKSPLKLLAVTIAVRNESVSA